MHSYSGSEELWEALIIRGIPINKCPATLMGRTNNHLTPVEASIALTCNPLNQS